MDYFKSKSNLRGIVLAFGLACTVSNAFAVSLAAPPETAGRNAAMAVQQKLTVTGNVSDAEGPLVGATIKIKGTSTGAVADIDGNFKISANFTVQNPFVLFSPFTNECGLDPETNTMSNDNSTMAVTMEGYTGSHKLPVVGYNTPATRNFLFGINLTF